MFGIGPTEFIIIAVLALMLFSPRELPKILRSAAKFWGSLRNTADEFRDAIMNEEEMHDLRGMLKGGANEFKRAEAAARRELMKARMEMQKAQNKLLKTVKAAEESKRAELAPAEGAPATDGAGTQEGAPTPGANDDGAPRTSGDPAASDPPTPAGAIASARPGAPEPASPPSPPAVVAAEKVDQGAA
ncbi:MAG: hypothetical protein IPK74_03965 [Deltaproteobacteria bacterium]|nr:hypothetical protein [Deltaproteobacteria bacterium]